MSLKNEIKGILEDTFDIPFDVHEEYRHEIPFITVEPSEGHGRLFSIHVSFQNKIRLNMEFEPQKYAVQMVHEMGNSSMDRKEIFCAYAKQLAQLGAKTQLRINNAPCNAEKCDEWPGHWDKVSLRTTVLPIEFDAMDKPDYHKTALRWIPLMMGISLSLLRVEKTESEDSPTSQVEGRKYDIVTSRYERSSINRMLCLSKYGYSCQVCGFNFERTYGDIGKEFIHVHHIIPVSQMGEDYHVNPLSDLVPVCPNCHAMLHRTNPPRSVEELRNMLNQ